MKLSMWRCVDVVVDDDANPMITIMIMIIIMMLIMTITINTVVVMIVNLH